MKQFILNTKEGHDGFYSIKSHYLVRVRRLAPGDIFQAVAPDNTVLYLQVNRIKDDLLVCESRGKKESPSSLLPYILLFQSMPKGSKMDLIIRQASESGVNEIVPFFSEYSVAKTGTDKIKRWTRIIKEARQQSGSPIDTKIREAVSLPFALIYWKELTERYGSKAGLLFHQGASPVSFYKYLRPVPQVLAVAVGPEGGFSSDDEAQFYNAGFAPVVLGNSVLRSETAAIAAITTVKALLFELSHQC